jgi:uncharacterized protein YutD
MRSVLKTKITPKDLYNRYLQMRSAVEVLKVMLYDYGITYSPTIVRKFELSQYVVAQLKDLGFTNYTDKRSAVSLVLNLNYLEYVQKVVKTNHPFQVGLNLVVSYLQYKQEVDYLENLYSFNDLRNRGFLKGKAQTRQVKVSEVKQKGEVPLWLPKTLNDEISVHDGYTEVEESLHSVYYRFLTKVAKELGVSVPTGWTFLSGVTRKQESSLLPLILKGSIEVQNEKISKVLESLRTDKGDFPYSLVYEDLLKVQTKVLEKYKKEDPDLMVRSITPFKVSFSRGGLKNYPLYYNYICWDYDNNKSLPSVNCFKGLGGEFTRVSFAGATPYYLRNEEGKQEIFYKMVSKSQLHSKNVHLEEYLKEFSQMFGRYFGGEGLLIPLAPTRTELIKRSLDRLEQKGVALVDSDS